MCNPSRKLIVLLIQIKVGWYLHVMHVLWKEVSTRLHTNLRITYTSIACRKCPSSLVYVFSWKAVRNNIIFGKRLQLFFGSDNNPTYIHYRYSTIQWGTVSLACPHRTCDTSMQLIYVYIVRDCWKKIFVEINICWPGSCCLIESLNHFLWIRKFWIRLMWYHIGNQFTLL